MCNKNNQKMIQDEKSIPFNQDFIITLTKTDNYSIGTEISGKCKILKIICDCELGMLVYAYSFANFIVS